MTKRLKVNSPYDGHLIAEINLDETSSVLIPEWISAESRKYGYDPLFLTALIITESSFYNWAKSNRGAHGLMQLKPATVVALASETRLK